MTSGYTRLPETSVARSQHNLQHGSSGMLQSCGDIEGRILASIISVDVHDSSHVSVGDTYINQTVYNDEVVRDVSLCECLCKLMKSTSRLERTSYAVVILLIMTSIAILAYYFIVVAKIDIEYDKPTNTASEWLVSRRKWEKLVGANSHYNVTMTTKYDPLKLVIVQYVPCINCFCSNYIECANLIYYGFGGLSSRSDDTIPYHFVITYDDRVYEGRGWGKEGNSSSPYDPCSLRIAFLGHPDNTEVSALQLVRLKLLLAKGVTEKHLHPKYVILVFKDINEGAYYDPDEGFYKYEAVKKTSHYDHKQKYVNMTCEEIREYTPDDDDFIDYG